MADDAQVLSAAGEKKRALRVLLHQAESAGPAGTAGFNVKDVPLPGTDRSITATVASQQLMAANTSRARFYIKNDSTIDVYVNLGATAVATAGTGNIKIPANGGYFELTGASTVVNIIAASGTPAITAREFS